ncbi:hypothetical protein WMF11_36625 [Sorangium sp. So ce295]|uniref:hypothetical protein n=1 Tax=Sorangium sp. So ce295 TaxID=3133295 RepID=UPI003F6314BC
MSTRERRPTRAGSALLWLAAAGCDDFHECDPPDAERQAELPSALSETGLYADIAARAVASDVVAYEPGFALWSDGAEKRRFIRLPPGAQIDTGDQDAWQFPDGTRLWKEFRRDGALVETRLLAKVGPAPEDWASVAYVWNADGTDALATPGGAADARGTPHDVPAQRGEAPGHERARCHRPQATAEMRRRHRWDRCGRHLRGSAGTRSRTPRSQHAYPLEARHAVLREML